MSDDLNQESLTPTEYLLTEVLAARHRTGESCWTFPRMPAITTAIRSLVDKGYVSDFKSPDGKVWQVFPSARGLAACLSPTYVTPQQRTERDGRTARVVCSCGTTFTLMA